MTDDEIARFRTEAEATLERLDWSADLRPRTPTVDIPSALHRWRAEAHEQERERRAATRRRHEQERADIMRAASTSVPNDIDDRIAAAVAAERKRNHKLMAQAFAEVLARIDQRHAEMLRTMEQRLENTVRAADNIVTRVTSQANGGPDASGIVRKQTICPGPDDLN